MNSINYQTYLVVDSRERNVIPYIDIELKNIKYIEKQINTGDYLICNTDLNNQPNILACIERKTLTDYAASFQDGRYTNIKKMIDLRNNTKCQLYFIIEGQPFPSPTKKYSRIPYSNILASITKLMIRDNIFIIQTLNEQHTAKRLADLTKMFHNVIDEKNKESKNISTTPNNSFNLSGNLSNDKLNDELNDELNDKSNDISNDKPNDKSNDKSNDKPNDISITGLVIGGVNENIPDIVLGRIPNDEIDICAKMWSKLNNVSIMMGYVLIGLFSFIDLINMEDTSGLNQLKHSSGTAFNKKAIKTLMDFNKNGNNVVLSGIDGININTIIDLNNFKEICKMSIEDISNLKIQQKTRIIKFGIIKAEKIYRMIRYKKRI